MRGLNRSYIWILGRISSLSIRAAMSMGTTCCCEQLSKKIKIKHTFRLCSGVRDHCCARHHHNRGRARSYSGERDHGCTRLCAGTCPRSRQTQCSWCSWARCMPRHFRRKRVRVVKVENYSFTNQRERRSTWSKPCSRPLKPRKTPSRYVPPSVNIIISQYAYNALPFITSFILRSNGILKFLFAAS